MSIRSLAIIAIALVATAFMSAGVPTCANAQGGCSEQCKAAFGSCYKATANRAACEAQLQRCLQGCIAGKRG